MRGNEGNGYGKWLRGVYKVFMGVMKHKNDNFSHFNEAKSFGDQKHAETIGEGFSLNSSK